MSVVNSRYFSIALNGNVSFNAVIPFENYGEFPNFNKKPFSDSKPLKTLYLLHGITDNADSWLQNSKIARYAEENHLAVIMPYGYNQFYVDSTVTERWGEFIGRELVEFTRGLFPLSTAREDTFIGGLSMGGYGAIRNGLKYNDTFSKIAALSSALITYDIEKLTNDSPIPIRRRSFCERIFGSLEQVAGSDKDPEQLYREIQRPVSVFMTIGDNDSLIEVNRRYKAFLEEQGADLTYYEEPGDHEWDFWDRNIKRAIHWLLNNTSGKPLL